MNLDNYPTRFTNEENTMNTKLITMILSVFLLIAGNAIPSSAVANDAKQSTGKNMEKDAQPETWPSAAEPGPTPGVCASFLDPGMKLIEENDLAKEKDEKAQDKDEKKDKKEEKKRRANAYTNPESTSCMV